MEFEDLKGIGEKTANKLREAGFTLDNIQKTDAKEISLKTGIQESLAKEIKETTSSVNSIPNPNYNNESTSKDNSNNCKHDINEAKKFLVRAFEKSEQYDEKNKEEKYSEWFEDLLKKNNRLRK